MKKPKYRKTHGHFARYSLMPCFNMNLTPSERWLYSEVFAYGPAGCWKSNETLAQQSGFCKRTIRRARQKLTHHMIIITARTLPRTWSCWASDHPAVKASQVLYFKGGEIDNPIFEASGGTNGGGTKCPVRGDKMSPKPEQGNPPKKGGCSQEVSNIGTASGKGDFYQGGDPPETPRAVQGDKSKTHARIVTDPSPRVKNREIKKKDT